MAPTPNIEFYFPNDNNAPTLEYSIAGSDSGSDSESESNIYILPEENADEEHDSPEEIFVQDLIWTLRYNPVKFMNILKNAINGDNEKKEIQEALDKFPQYYECNYGSVIHTLFYLVGDPCPTVLNYQGIGSNSSLPAKLACDIFDILISHFEIDRLHEDSMGFTFLGLALFDGDEDIYYKRINNQIFLNHVITSCENSYL